MKRLLCSLVSAEGVKSKRVHELSPTNALYFKSFKNCPHTPCCLTAMELREIGGRRHEIPFGSGLRVNKKTVAILRVMYAI